MNRRCTTCYRVKPTEEFRGSIDPSTLTKTCQSCRTRVLEANRRRVAKNVRPGDSSHRFKTYGLTSFDYDNIVKAQEGKCAICKEPLTNVSVIDHCHGSRKVRGILCRPCNTGLGLFKDNTKHLLCAVEYLSKNSMVK